MILYNEYSTKRIKKVETSSSAQFESSEKDESLIKDNEQNKNNYQ